MAGLLDQAMSGAQQTAPAATDPAAQVPTPQDQAAAPAQDADVQGQDSNVTPQEQETFTRLGYAAKIALWDKKTHQSFMDILKQKGAPENALAQTASTLFQQIDHKTGNKIPENMIFRAAEQVLDLVIDMAEETKTMQVDETLANKAVQQLMLLLAQAYNIDPQEVKSFIDSMPPEQVKQAVDQQQKIAGAGTQPTPSNNPAAGAQDGTG